MLSSGTPVGNIQPYFLTQAVPALDRSKPLDQQPELAAIQDQALAVADIFAQFIEGATTSLDIAIYDFRLLPGALTDQIVVRRLRGRPGAALQPGGLAAFGQPDRDVGGLQGGVHRAGQVVVDRVGVEADLGRTDPAGVQQDEHQVRGQHGQGQCRQPPRCRLVRRSVYRQAYTASTRARVRGFCQRGPIWFIT
jgi:hypothetical protein